MNPTVLLTRIDDWSDPALVERCFAALLRRVSWEDMPAKALVAIKLTFGEAGNEGHPPPHLVRQLARLQRDHGHRPFVTETNTLYRGRRMNAVEHLEVAREHGFTHETVEAPIILSDGLSGRDSFAVEIGCKRVTTAHLAPVVRDLDYLIGVAHLTGHMVEGFGGAIKNLGMGLASRAGKLDQHSAVSPIVGAQKCVRCFLCGSVCPVDAITLTDASAEIDGRTCIGCAECIAVCPTAAIGIDWSREATHVMEATAEYAQAVMKATGRRAGFFNLINRVTKHCDCMGANRGQLVPDIGIAFSHDPVALDQACVDLVNQAAEMDVFKQAWPEIEWEVQLRHGETIGLGKRTYELEEVSCE